MPSFVEEVGLECALWPHLYWRTDMCESHERSTDCRRVERKSRKFAESSGEEGDDDSDDEAEGARHSMRKSFMAKVLSPLLGYGSTFELVQYVYDLNLWSDLGAKKNLRNDVPLRLFMKGHSAFGQYWKDVHNGLIDLVRQFGTPSLFWNLSPYEYLMSYHQWMEDEMKKSFRARLHLPAAEALHMAHTLT